MFCYFHWKVGYCRLRLPDMLYVHVCDHGISLPWQSNNWRRCLKDVENPFPPWWPTMANQSTSPTRFPRYHTEVLETAVAQLSSGTCGMVFEGGKAWARGMLWREYWRLSIGPKFCDVCDCVFGLGVLPKPQNWQAGNGLRRTLSSGICLVSIQKPRFPFDNI